MATDSSRRIDLVLDCGANRVPFSADGSAGGDGLRMEGDPRYPAHCSACDAVCCRLTVVLDANDDIPAHLTTTLPEGPRVMAKGEGGWCVALDAERMNCGIYEIRPAGCRRFVMNGPYCRAVRDDYAMEAALAASLRERPGR